MKEYHISTIQIIFAVLLFICLFDMPYGYYQLIRFLALIIFGFLAYKNFQEEITAKAVICLALAILFNLCLKFHWVEPFGM